MARLKVSFSEHVVKHFLRVLLDRRVLRILALTFSMSFYKFPYVDKKLKDRNEAILWARDLIQRSDWLIMDTETTGLKQSGRNLSSYDEIIQIGIMDPHGKVVFESLINPVKRRIAKEAKDLHGIDLRMLKDAPRFEQIFPQLRDILHGKLVIAYNVKFEQQMFIQTFAKIPEEFRKTDLEFRFHCAMEEYAQYVGEWNDYYNEYKWQKLPGATHNVIEDCSAVLKIIKEMANAQLSPIPDPWWKNLLNYFRRKK